MVRNEVEDDEGELTLDSGLVEEIIKLEVAVTGCQVLGEPGTRWCLRC